MIVHIRYEVHLINNLKTKFLININILESKQVIIDILSQKLRFEFCEKVAISCEIKIKNNVRIRRIVRTTKKEIIFAKLITKIAIILKEKNKLLKRNFLFKLIIFEAYTYFINANFYFINFRNNKEFSLKLNNCCCIKRIVEYENKKCYVIKKKNYFFATIFFFKDYLILSKLNLAKIRLF